MPNVSLEFSSGSMLALNAIIALMMFGVSLELRRDDFIRILRQPKAPAIGMLIQFLLLPALTCLLTIVLPIDPELALGMILVATCPSGTFSNIMTWMARGNVAVSASVTAVSGLSAGIFTPLNFALYAGLNPATRERLTQIHIEPLELIGMVVLVLILPMLAGMLLGRARPRLAQRLEKPLRKLSLLVMLGFVGMAFAKNFQQFIAWFHLFFWLVVLLNGTALLLGYTCARLWRLQDADVRAVTLESGIHNSALGMALILTFFPQAGGMLLIAAFWGCWQLFSGLLLAQWWARREPRGAALVVAEGSGR
ncbi:bile acid:sodium symporter family protein [Pseudomonas sp. ZM23]|uniref:Bile acid:sodium symporter family protein n=1 Tax=Pseudomonas triclosanedens TaxID=2961893 RepID=A0ABY7A556_9PSED|nr:bile acid:sodium symporter family protein [Pseudomonas triclosanedens]MCP8465576.1 bile acid:sodium symporter family protein [Pseudomonas triclosanedens]MCP8471071.1 bile acid:sodium symporter family protein [Pseudomonas triclosanedens]MCP8476875.1 bile acid:sodium symporter family protein [Pseudomonas triclosanedens]WAI52012.1 bile acid:sodium symporter family protein [Pseudomonas triclosanedens]